MSMFIHMGTYIHTYEYILIKYTCIHVYITRDNSSNTK